MQLTVRQLEDIESKLRSKDSTIKRVREEAEKAVLQVVRTVEIAGTGFGLGVINGRYGSPSLLGVPVDLLVGIGAHAVAFFDIAPDHMHAVGDGGLAAYATALGTGVGNKMLAESQKAAAAAAAQIPAPRP